MRFSTVLFDLDGTLTDPGEGIARSILAALHEVGLTKPSPRRLRLCVGPPLRQSFRELGASPEQVEGLVELYRSRYRCVGMFENAVYPGIPRLLGQLASQGCQLFVATSKPTSFAEAILEHFRLRDFFVAVHGAEPDGRLGDKRELLAHVRQTIAFAPAETALVGDREFDVAAARAESVFAVGALWGYGTRSELVAAGANALASRPSGVMAALASGR